MNKTVKWVWLSLIFYLVNISYVSGSQYSGSLSAEAILTGFVTDLQTQVPLFGAMVTVEGYPTVFTDSSGHYSITVSEGLHDINCITFGYHRVWEHDFSITGATQLNFTLIPDPCGPPLNLNGDLVNLNFAFLSWNPTSIAPFPDEWIHFDNGSNFTSIGLTGGGTFTAAIRFNSDQLLTYAGYYLTMIRIFPVGINTQYILKVWTGENAGNLVSEKTLNSLVLNEWNDIPVDIPVLIDPLQELWFGYTCADHPPNVYPAGCDIGPAVTGFGDMFSLDGSTWETLSSYGFDYNWNIEGYVQSPNDGSKKISEPDQNRSLIGFNIYRNNQLMSQSPVTQNVFLDGPLPSASVFVYYVTALYTQCESVPSGSAIIWTEGVEENTINEDILIFPDPVQDLMNIRSPIEFEQVLIYNYIGNLIYIDQLSGTTARINVSGYKNGIYLLILRTSSGEIAKKFVVKKA
jgi:hypothetical protein